MKFRSLAILCVLAALPIALQAQEARLLRFPAIHGNQIVFSYAGDLYTVSASGGTARKITTDIGYEMFARFSPDGKWLAFTGQYDGNTEVFLMPSEGGVPKRLTYTATLGRDDVSDRMGPNNIVMAWKDDKTIVYRSRRTERNDFIGQLYFASVDGGSPEQLPLPRGGFTSFSPDKKKMAYNRVFREFRTWKRYRGGQADDVWIYDFETKQITNVTNNPAQDIIPMWSGNKIYFASDRDSRMNLFVYDLDSKQTKKLTNFTDFDVKFPSLGDKAIVFENGGYIYKLDLATEQAAKVSISIQEDFDIGRGGLKDVSKEVTNYEISPDGNRALFGARGEVFTVPAKYGNTRNITNTSGVHERNSKWSPDGKWIAYISDASGEDEIYVVAQDGKGAPVQLTRNADTYKYQMLWSPDSKKLVWGDKKLRLQYVDVDSKSTTIVAQAKSWEITQFNWSPDSRWLTYSLPEEKTMSTVQLYSLDKKESYPVTDGWFESYGAAFGADGKYLFFLSDRSYSPTYSSTEWNHSYNDMAGIYLVALTKDTKSPFAPKSDEVTVTAKEKAEAKKDDEKKDDKKEDSKVSVKVDLEGLQSRVTALPVDAAWYGNLTSVGEKLYYTRSGSKDEKTKIMMYDLGKQKEAELGEFNGFEISADGKKMLVGGDGAHSIIDLPSSKIDASEKLNIGDMKTTLDRKAEWKQIYNECWRQMRDFFYAPNMHGVNWEQMRKNYEPLLSHVNHRADLTYIIGELIGELNVGHAYVGGGDYPKPERIQLGLLGAQLQRDASSRFYRITKILKGQNWDKALRSPLTEIGVDVREGDYIIAINGKKTSEMNDVYESLINTAGKQVTLTLNSDAKESGGREVVVVPTASEQQLYYLNWVQGNIEKVSKATDGKVGYVHIPNMGADGLNEFVKYYYPQLRKEGLIVDVRGNGGGNVSPMIIERLRREIAMIGIARNAAVNLDPGGMVLGPKVMLLDEFSASDGDIVAYRFKKYKLGPVIGKRSWGGVVGIRGSLPLLDGGYLNRPEFSRYDVEGKEWIMEGKGVDPDIFVDNDPAHEFAGTDDQLNKGIEVIKEEMRKNPVKLPDPPPYPDKSK
ncbi:MAG: PDZ domain-containing protein [Bacteroidota bacterium]